MRMPLPMENHTNEIFNQPCQYTNLEDELRDINIQLKTALSQTEWRVYTLLYTQHYSEDEVMKTMDFHPVAGRKILTKIKQNIKKVSIALVHEKTRG